MYICVSQVQLAPDQFYQLCINTIINNSNYYFAAAAITAATTLCLKNKMTPMLHTVTSMHVNKFC